MEERGASFRKVLKKTLSGSGPNSVCKKFGQQGQVQSRSTQRARMSSRTLIQFISNVYHCFYSTLVWLWLDVVFFITRWLLTSLPLMVSRCALTLETATIRYLPATSYHSIVRSLVLYTPDMSNRRIILFTLDKFVSPKALQLLSNVYVSVFGLTDQGRHLYCLIKKKSCSRALINALSVLYRSPYALLDALRSYFQWICLLFKRISKTRRREKNG